MFIESKICVIQITYEIHPDGLRNYKLKRILRIHKYSTMFNRFRNFELFQDFQIKTELKTYFQFE